MGRNDPCWCGSGKKYKKCHLDRDSQSRVTIQDGIKENIKARKKYCLHPEANSNICNKIINAHSIQKSGILSLIARDQHVYSFSAELGDMVKNDGLAPKLIGINKASTFTGFCNYHDTETFKPIENNCISVTNEHIFLIAYRSLCKEIYAKNFQLEMLPFNIESDKGFSIHDQKSYQSFIKIYSEAVKAGRNDLLKCKEQYDRYLLAQYYDDIIYLVIEIDQVPEIMSSGQIFVEIDFDGNILQKPEEIEDFENKLDRISFSILLSNNNGLIVFSCFKEEVKSIRFIESIDRMEINEIPNAIMRFTFEFFENTFMNPDWWENLGEKIQEDIIKRMNISASLVERDNNILKNDGNNYVNWRVINKYKNF